MYANTQICHFCGNRKALWIIDAKLKGLFEVGGASNAKTVDEQIKIVEMRKSEEGFDSLGEINLKRWNTEKRLQN